MSAIEESNINKVLFGPRDTVTRIEANEIEMEKIVCLLLVVAAIDTRVSADMDIDVKPEAAKLTIDIDSVSQRIPPQIAYFIPDRVFNATGFGMNNGPPIIDLTPPYGTLNRTNFNFTDLMTSSQHPYRFFVVPKEKHEKHRSFVDEDPATAYQNFNYQIDFKKVPDKRPDFSRFEKLMKTHKTSGTRVKSAKIKKKHIKKPVSSEEHFNYANNSPHIRNRIKYIKTSHRDKFEASNHRDSYDNDEIDDDNNGDSEMADRAKVYNAEVKMRKTRKKYKKPYSAWTKLSQPMSSENESSYDDNSNMEPIEVDGYDHHTHHSDAELADHKNCDHQLPNSEQQYDDYDVMEHRSPKINHPPKGFSIYLTKVMQKPHRSLRMDVNANNKKSARVPFVPTRIMSSVRGVETIVHKPRKHKKPTMRERLSESGGHVVYTEDGYEDTNYDHGKENKALAYKRKVRVRRSTVVANKDLRGQELIDHLGDLIRNVSDYLDSSEIIPDIDKKKYPLYNSTDSNIKDSPIEYSEYAKPVVDDDFSTELYESKTKNCSEDVEEEVDLSSAHNETDATKKRLGNLGDKLECLKEKLFGEDPLDNPLFKEENITEPQSDKVQSLVEAESVQTISTVYNDIMDNIKHHSRNENQRVFSDFGISDNFAVGTINTNNVRARPSRPMIQTSSSENELNTMEKYPDTDKYKPEILSGEKPPPPQHVTKSPLAVFNTFNNPAQVPILDISKFIPKINFAETDTDSQTDFVPIVSPSYISETYQWTKTPPTNTPPSKPKYGYTQPSRKVPSSYGNTNNDGNSKNNYPNANRNQPQKVIILRRRLPIALVRRVPPKNA